jgi:phosphohistidine phosphatase SixA
MIVFVLLHANKRREPANADELVTAGRERAELLARMLAESGVTFAYHSGAIRARQTLEPLVRERGNALTIRPLIPSPDDQNLWPGYRHCLGLTTKRGHARVNRFCSMRLGISPTA